MQPRFNCSIAVVGLNMKRTSENKGERRELTHEQSDLSVNFYNVANDLSKETFAQVARRVLGPKGFGRSKTAAAFKRDAQKKMFNLTR